MLLKHFPPPSLSICPCLFSSPAPFLAESIQTHPNVFLESEQAHRGSVSQQPTETQTEGGGRDEGGRRASVTSVESETSICSMGQLGNTIANSEWEGRRVKQRLSCLVCSIISCPWVQIHAVSQIFRWPQISSVNNNFFCFKIILKYTLVNVLCYFPAFQVYLYTVYSVMCKG